MRKVPSALIGALLLAGGCASSREPAAKSALGAVSGAYFGAVAMSADRLALTLGTKSAGSQPMEAFVVGGDPRGDVEWFSGSARDDKFELQSVSGKARLSGVVEAAQATGTFVGADGRSRVFYTIPATHGAGIYDVTVTSDLAYKGSSLAGAKLVGRKVGDFVEGDITDHGEKIHYRVTDMSRAFGFEQPGGRPDTYKVVVSRYGLVQVGHSGGVSSGKPGNNFLSLDLGASKTVTPGLYYGKLDGSRHQFVLALAPRDEKGERKLRLYLSNGEPDPEGRIEWFTQQLAANHFDVTSASGGAHLVGDIAEDRVTGTVTLADGTSHKIFAVPAGDGAGIYDIEVTPEGKYHGTSDTGATLELTQTGSSVTGTLTPNGAEPIQVQAYDLTRVFKYDVEGSKPDTYVAFASPGGRYLIGRSGSVRKGSSGSNIIGLDKAC